MGEFDADRTYAIPKLKWALCDPHGAPVSLHGSPDLALVAWMKSRGFILLADVERPGYFRKLQKESYSIRPAQAWCRVQPHPIEKMPRLRRVKPKFSPISKSHPKRKKRK